MQNQANSGSVTSACFAPDQLALQAIDQNNWKTDKRVAEAELPQELITEILICSPVKSLLRFRCVSKSFCTIIGSKQFINLHQNRSLENKKHPKLIIRRNPMAIWLDSLYVFDLDNLLEQEIEKPYLKKAIPYGYCNGLVLLFVHSSKLALWNPSTREYRDLPRCPIEIPKGGHCSRFGMGLGYDSTCDDYKVVLIAGTKINDNVHDLQVWTFGLGSNSWKKSIQDFPYRKNRVPYFGHFANGSLHWLCKQTEIEYALVAFDLTKETITEVSQPPYRCKHERDSANLHGLDGRLCMSFFSWQYPGEAVFYVGEKDGTEEFIWSKLFSVAPETALLFDITWIDMTRFKDVKVVGCSKERDKILLDLDYNFIVSYDLKKKSFSATKIREIIVNENPKRVHIYPFLFHESLVSVRGGDLGQKSGPKRKRTP